MKAQEKISSMCPSRTPRHWPSLSIPDSSCFVRAPSEKACCLAGWKKSISKQGVGGKWSQVGIIWFPVYFSSVKSGHHKVTCSPSQPGTYSYLEQFHQGGKKTAETNTWKLKSRQWCLIAYCSHTNLRIKLPYTLSVPHPASCHFRSKGCWHQSLHATKRQSPGGW